MRRSEFTSLILRRLDLGAKRISADWKNPHAGTPTHHCAIDDLLPENCALEAFKAFPKDGEGFITRNSFRERKRTSYDLDSLPEILTEITFALQSAPIVEKVAELTGIDALEPDPHLYAGGLSMMFKSDFLNPHIDNSHEKTKSKYRRLNLLYYVSPDWKEEYGGNLELWDPDVTRPVTLTSKFNRLILMETNSRSWHSVSPIVADGPRCCVSNYYFSDRSPSGKDYYHVTSFTGRPHQHVRRALGTIDNNLRTLARKAGVSRKTDKGYEGEKAMSSSEDQH